MHTIAELPSFTISAKQAGLSELERFELDTILAKSPDAGDIIVGSGGCRKLRLKGKGKGKSGGYRVVTFFYNEGHPVYLVYVFAKSQTENLSKTQISQLADLAKELKNG